MVLQLQASCLLVLLLENWFQTNSEAQLSPWSSFLLSHSQFSVLRLPEHSFSTLAGAGDGATILELSFHQSACSCISSFITLHHMISSMFTVKQSGSNSRNSISLVLPC